MTKPKTPKIEDAAITHKKCVFADDEFVGITRAFAYRLGIDESNPIERMKYGDEYYFVVGSNAEKIVSKDEIEQLNKLAAEFGILITDVVDYLNDSHKSPVYKYTKPRVEVRYWPPDGITIKVPPDATKQDVIDQLDRVKMLQGLFYKKSKKTKRKPPQNYQLIYAVFRARAKGLKFSEIFRAYQEGHLSLYAGSNAQYKSADDLARYYRKYKPKKDS